MRDLVDQIKVKPLIPPMVLEGNMETPLLSMEGYNSLTITISVGKGLDLLSDTNCIQFVLEHGATKEGLQPVKDVHIIGGDLVVEGVIYTLNSSSQAETLKSIGYSAYDPFVRLKVAMRGEHKSGVPLACSAILGHGERMPPESFLESFDAFEDCY